MPRVTELPDLRPLGIGEILDRALKIVWRNARTLATVVLFVVFPVQVVSTLISASASPSSLNSGSTFGTANNSISTSDIGTLAAAGLATIVLGFIGSTLASGACFRAIASAYLGERTGWRDSLRFAFRRLPSILWVSFLAALLAGLGFIACVLPGVYLWVGYSVAIPVLLTESERGRHALKRSRSLVRDFWWRAFAVVLLGYILSGIIDGAISGLLVGATSISRGSTSVAAIVVSIVVGTASKLITTPFIAAFVTVLYFDLRVRKEGFDLQLLAQRIGVDPPPGLPIGTNGAEDAGSDRPPFWPPPPGWKPGGGGA
jgi:hypothetical protein